MNHLLNCSSYPLLKPDIVRGEGCYLYDSRDRRYIDFEAGVWCTALGHNHRRVNEAIQRQLTEVSHLGYRYASGVMEDAAAAVVDIVGLPDGQCVFLSSGSEAVEFGVQLARRISARPLLLTLTNSYLAAYGSAGQKSTAEWHLVDWQGCPTCPLSYTCDPDCPLITQIPMEQVGGLVFEPGNSGGLVKLPPASLVRQLVEMIREQHGLVIVDEVTTGMGRTGAWFGFQHYGLQPDIVALGKGLGNGYPVSAVAMTRPVAEALQSRQFYYAQSHQNDPLGCAVAQEVISVMREENLIARSAAMGALFLLALNQLARHHRHIKEVRGRGLMIALEFESGDGDFSLSRVFEALGERGFLVGYKPAANLLRFYPPLTIAETDIARLVEALADILPETEVTPA
jgi:acetylornithine aminotransferase